jgi:undecaprenyl-diphosphatase
MRGLDRAVFYWINGWPEGLRGIMWFFSQATSLPWFKLLLAAFALAMIAASRLTRRAMVQALVAFPLANELTDVIKAAFPFPRPYQASAEMTGVIHRLGESSSYGTASAHSANMAAVAFVMCWHLRWWGVPWALIALLTGISRIYNGDHFPHQVLLGWLCGCFVALVVIRTWEAYLRMRDPRRDEHADGINVP